MKIYWIAAAVFLAGAGIFGTTACKKADHQGHDQAAQAAKYHCPMHPTYVSDKPGDCPICGMRLVPIESPQAHEAAVAQAPAPAFYRHPMKPEITSPVPKKDEMGMDYVPVFPDGPAERAAVSLAPDRRQMIGVRTAPVARRDLAVLVRASGRVAYDPDLYGTIVEYREALKARDQAAESEWGDVRERADSLVRSAALRLRQMGLAQDQIQRLGRRQEDPTQLLLGGQGGPVWIYAQVFEYEAGLVKAGQKMEVTSTAFPGKTAAGRVVAVDTILNPETRTLRVRGEVADAGGLLKPEMYVEATIYIALGKKLAVPTEAVLDTGTRRIVFVESSPGMFEPREVKLGRQAEGFYEVVSGVKEGEQAVVSGNFLIDSESRLKAAVSGAGHSH